jgi:hypothetical protein
VAIDAIDDGDTVAARNELSEATERTAHYDVEGEKPRVTACGGCGETDGDKRCLGCGHDFGDGPFRMGVKGGGR